MHTAGDNQKNAIAPQEIDVKFPWKWEKYGGVKGMLPLGCLPLWGEWGSLSLPHQNEKDMGSKMLYSEQSIAYFF